MIKVKTKRFKTIWEGKEIIAEMRGDIQGRIENDIDNGLVCDSQDLEHQVLFRVSLGDGETVDNIYKEQRYITKERMKNAKISPKDLFCFGVKRREHGYKMQWNNGKTRLYAVSYTFEMIKSINKRLQFDNNLVYVIEK